MRRQHKTSTLSGERGREAEREYLCCFWVIDMKGCADAKADQGQRTARAVKEEGSSTTYGIIEVHPIFCAPRLGEPHYDVLVTAPHGWWPGRRDDCAGVGCRRREGRGGRKREQVRTLSQNTRAHTSTPPPTQAPVGPGRNASRGAS